MTKILIYLGELNTRKSLCIILNFTVVHDDVIKWKHFPRYRPFVRGIHQSPVNSPHKGQWRGALMFSLIYARINGWVLKHWGLATHVGISILRNHWLKQWFVISPAPRHYPSKCRLVVNGNLRTNICADWKKSFKIISVKLISKNPSAIHVYIGRSLSHTKKDNTVIVYVVEGTMGF